MRLLNKYRWHVAQIIVLVITMLAFFTWAPWLAAVPVSEVPPSQAAALPAGCPAASMEHGTWSCRWYGTIRSNPWGFALCSAIVLGGWAFLIISALYAQGFRLRKQK